MQKIPEAFQKDFQKSFFLFLLQCTVLTVQAGL